MNNNKMKKDVVSIIIVNNNGKNMLKMILNSIKQSSLVKNTPSSLNSLFNLVYKCPGSFIGVNYSIIF